MFNLILSLLLSSQATHAANTEIEKIQKRFNQTKAEFFKVDFTKKNLKQKTTELLKKLNDDLEEVKKHETKQGATTLSAEGDQMALDIVLLEPLEQLAKTKMSKQDCTEAKHANELFESAEEDGPNNRTKPVELILTKICN